MLAARFDLGRANNLIKLTRLSRSVMKVGRWDLGCVVLSPGILIRALGRYAAPHFDDVYGNASTRPLHERRSAANKRQRR